MALQHRGGLWVVTPSWVPYRALACVAGFFHLCEVGFTGDAARAVFPSLSSGPDVRHHGRYVPSFSAGPDARPRGRYVPEGVVLGWFLLVTTHLALYSFSCRQAQMLGISAGMEQKDSSAVINILRRRCRGLFPWS